MILLLTIVSNGAMAEYIANCTGYADPGEGEPMTVTIW